jgi:hypothetical protein
VGRLTGVVSRDFIGELVSADPSLLLFGRTTGARLKIKLLGTKYTHPALVYSFQLSYLFAINSGFALVDLPNSIGGGESSSLGDDASICMLSRSPSTTKWFLTTFW